MMLVSIIAMCSGVALAIIFGFVMKDKQVLALGAAFMTAYGSKPTLLKKINFYVKTERH